MSSLIEEINRLRQQVATLTRERDEARRVLADHQAKIASANHDGGAVCDYCHGIGACPRCWGRAGIERLTRERDEIGADAMRLRVPAGGLMQRAEHAEIREKAATERAEKAERRVAELEGDLTTARQRLEWGKEREDRQVGTIAALRAQVANLREVNAEVFRALVKADPKVGDVATVDLARAVDALAAQVATLTRERDNALIERGAAKDALNANTQNCIDRINMERERAERTLKYGRRAVRLWQDAKSQVKALREALINVRVPFEGRGPTEYCWCAADGEYPEHHTPACNRARAALAYEAAPADWSPAAGGELVSGAMAAGALGAAIPGQAPAPETPKGEDRE